MGTVVPFQNSSQQLRLALCVCIVQDGLCTKYLINGEMEAERHADDEEESTDFLLLTYILGMCYPNSAFSHCKHTAVKNATLVPNSKISPAMSKQGDMIKIIMETECL